MEVDDDVRLAMSQSAVGCQRCYTNDSSAPVVAPSSSSNMNPLFRSLSAPSSDTCLGKPCSVRLRKHQYLFYSSASVTVSAHSLSSFSRPTNRFSSSTLTSSSSSSSSAPVCSRILVASCDRLLPCSTLDDDINIDSPDSGFESTSPSTGAHLTDYFDQFKSDDSIDELSKSSSASSSTSFADNRLCLARRPEPDKPAISKVEEPAPLFVCKWEGCGASLPSGNELHTHVNAVHVASREDRFCCLWHQCKVYNTPARSLAWLKQHVTTHTGHKRFKCVLDGCGASFSSQQGLARHVPSHFNDVGLPKARVSSLAERRFLVKRRRIKDRKKPLANVHDHMDVRTLDRIVCSLVSLANPSTSVFTPPDDHQIVCKRRAKNGFVWNLLRDGTWSHGPESTNHESLLFFTKPTKRSRKHKVRSDAKEV